MKTAAHGDIRAETPISPPVRAQIDELRDRQTDLVEHIRSASARISGDSSRVAFSLAGHARLTQQFFDAQRAILMRLASFDAAAGEPDESVGDPFVERASVELADAQRELANVLDDWWAAVNRHGEQMLADRSAGSVPARAGVADLAADSAADSASPSLAATADRPSPASVPASATPVLPSSVLRALDRADASNLESVLASLAESLRATAPVEVPVPELQVSSTDDLLINLREWSSDDLLPVHVESLDRDVTVESNDESDLKRLVMRTLLPMVMATAGLTAVMAWIG